MHIMNDVASRRRCSVWGPDKGSSTTHFNFSVHFPQGLGPDIDIAALEDRIFCLKTRDTAVRTCALCTGTW